MGNFKRKKKKDFRFTPQSAPIRGNTALAASEKQGGKQALLVTDYAMK